MNTVRYQPPVRNGHPVVRSLSPCHSRAGRVVLESMTDSEQTSVLITGGNKGLGFEAARRLGERGWTIFLGSRDESRGRAAANKLTDDAAEPNSDIKVQVRKGHRMFLASVIEPHTLMSTINSRNSLCRSVLMRAVVFDKPRSAARVLRALAFTACV